MEDCRCAAGERRRTMAQPDFAEEMRAEGEPLPAAGAMTGGCDKDRFLYYQLKMSMSLADRVDIIVSFLMAVSYTHLDVYKRQPMWRLMS